MSALLTLDFANRPYTTFIPNRISSFERVWLYTLALTVQYYGVSIVSWEVINMIRKIVDKVPSKLLRQDLAKYRQRAIELGATDAKVINTKMIVIDERVRAKCLIPACSKSGICGHCPPYTLDLDVMRKIVNNFHYALFSKIEVASEEITVPRVLKNGQHVRTVINNHEIVSKIEAEAFYDGYYLAMALADGSCKSYFCPDIDCSALLPGQACRHPRRARPSMEALGIDVYLLATRVGWSVYPIGRNTSAMDVPYGMSLGIVLIY